jgi:hypothetical protein
LHNFNPKKLD